MELPYTTEKSEKETVKLFSRLYGHARGLAPVYLGLRVSLMPFWWTACSWRHLALWPVSSDFSCGLSVRSSSRWSSCRMKLPFSAMKVLCYRYECQLGDILEYIEES